MTILETKKFFNRCSLTVPLAVVLGRYGRRFLRSIQSSLIAYGVFDLLLLLCRSVIGWFCSFKRRVRFDRSANYRADGRG